MTSSFAAVTGLVVVWFLVVGTYSKHDLNVAKHDFIHDDQHLYMKSGANVNYNSSSVQAYLSLKAPLGLGKGGQGGTIWPGGPGGPGSNSTDQHCVDRSPRCKVLARRKDCEKNAVFMYKNCKKSCKFCPGNERPDYCVDKHPRCKDWAEIGECQARPKFMHAKCKKSCNMCQGGNGTAPVYHREVKCPDDIPASDVHWHYWGKGLCYAYINEMKTWDEAHKFCKNLDQGRSQSGKKWKTGLIAPLSQDLILELADKYGYDNEWNTNPSVFLKGDAHTRHSGPWIGGTDSAKEGKWVWKGHKEKFSRDDIPNGDYFDNNEGPTGDEDCLEIFNDKGLVNDLDCDFWKLHFICEAVEK